MTVLNRTSLPREFVYRGKIYKRLGPANGMYSLAVGAIKLKVLSHSLKGKLNLHGKPYQPTEWIFIPA